MSARSKIRKPRKSRKSQKFFSKNFKSEFSILAVAQNRKLGNKKTRNNFSEISSDFSEFSICHFFHFFKKIFFNILKYRNSCSYMYLKIRVLKNCVGVYFLKDCRTGAFLLILRNFKNSFFIEHLRWLLVKVSNSVLYIYVMYCFPSLLKCFFLQQKHNFQNITML